jgi:AmmeMemoRadiSam system protein B
VFAGSWYPARASECEAEIQGFIEKSHISPPRNLNPVGGVVPHAGWFFSGNIACNVIHCLKKAGLPAPDVVLVFGMHLHSSSPNIMMPKGAWETPFGNLPVAEDLAAEDGQRGSLPPETSYHFTQDNTIELQLPFIKYFFPEAKILAMESCRPTPHCRSVGACRTAPAAGADP